MALQDYFKQTAISLSRQAWTGLKGVVSNSNQISPINMAIGKAANYLKGQIARSEVLWPFLANAVAYVNDFVLNHSNVWNTQEWSDLGSCVDIDEEMAINIHEAIKAIGTEQSGLYHYVASDANGFFYKLIAPLNIHMQFEYFEAEVVYLALMVGDELVPVIFKTLDESDAPIHLRNLWIPINGTINDFIVGDNKAGTTWWDLCRSQMESLDLNKALLALSNAYISQRDGFASLLSTMADGFQSVYQTFQNGIQAYVEGGWHGLAAYIMSFFNSKTGLTEDGAMEFTDNSEFIPSIYIVGCISTIVQTANILVSAVASCINVGVGMAVSLLSPLIGGVVQSLAYDSAATRCGIQIGADALYDVAPWAIAHRRIWIGDYDSNGNLVFDDGSWREIAEDVYCDGQIKVYDVPGGHLLAGVGESSYSSAGVKRAWLNVEFHPSCLDYFSQISAKLSQYYELPGGLSNFRLGIYHNEAATSNRQDISDFWKNLVDSDSSTAFINSTNNRLTSSEDKRLRRAIIGNTALFAAWILGLRATSSGTEETLGCFGGSGTELHIVDRDNTQYTVYSDTAAWLTYVAAALPWSHNPDTSTTTYIPNTTEWKAWGQLVSLLNDDSSFNARFGDAMPTFGAPASIRGSFSWYINPAQYDHATFITSIILASAVAVTVAITAVCATVKFVKWRRKLAQSTMRNAENAWEEYKSNPNPTTARGYNRAVRKNNLLAFITGNSKLSKASYWQSPADGSSDVSTATGDFSTGFSDNPLLTKNPGQVDGSNCSQSEVTGALLYKLIAGVEFGS